MANIAEVINAASHASLQPPMRWPRDGGMKMGLYQAIGSTLGGIDRDGCCEEKS